MAYIDQYAAARDANFLKRLEIALVVVARDVINTETKDVVNHYNRAILATAVFKDPAFWVQAFKDAVAANLITDAGSTDADFFSAVNFFWNAYAGVTLNGALV